jgi:hypothetical protein
MLFCFILLSLCVFLVLQVRGRKGVNSGNLDLKEQKKGENGILGSDRAQKKCDRLQCDRTH